MKTRKNFKTMEKQTFGAASTEPRITIDAGGIRWNKLATEGFCPFDYVEILADIDEKMLALHFTKKQLENSYKVMRSKDKKGKLTGYAGVVCGGALKEVFQKFLVKGYYYLCKFDPNEDFETDKNEAMLYLTPAEGKPKQTRKKTEEAKESEPQTTENE